MALVNSCGALGGFRWHLVCRSFGGAHWEFQGWIFTDVHLPDNFLLLLFWALGHWRKSSSFTKQIGNLS